MSSLEISVREAHALIESVAPVRLIDVREPGEFALRKIACSELIPLSRLSCEASERLPDKSQRILVLCLHGMRSMSAARHLRALGYRNVQSVAGGIESLSKVHRTTCG